MNVCPLEKPEIHLIVFSPSTHERESIRKHLKYNHQRETTPNNIFLKILIFQIPSTPPPPTYCLKMAVIGA
jgi:hypothetical protein